MKFKTKLKNSGRTRLVRWFLQFLCCCTALLLAVITTIVIGQCPNFSELADTKRSTLMTKYRLNG